jgi:hypothetical protein
MRSINGLSCGLICLLSIWPIMAPTSKASADDQPNRILIEYDPPKNPAHQPLYEMIKEHQVLEKIQKIFSPLKLPIDVTIKATGCDGHVNAWYARPTLTICYEYLDEIRRDMPAETTATGVTPIDGELGQFFFAVAHEMGHGAFDLFNTPIFGRQEDAADSFATYIMLQFGKSDARRLIGGAAYSYMKYLKQPTVTAPLKDFSDAHGSPQQRFFNLICLAYGADPVLFADVVEKKMLPEHRAKGCKYEYGNVVWAFHELIVPNVDQGLAKHVMDKTWLPPEKENPAQGSGTRALQQ